jgi:hypothetical protein
MTLSTDICPSLKPAFGKSDEDLCAMKIALPRCSACRKATRAVSLTICFLIFGGCATPPPQIIVSSPGLVQGKGGNAELLAVVWKDVEKALRREHGDDATFVFPGDSQPRRSIWSRRKEISCRLTIEKRTGGSATVDVWIWADREQAIYDYKLIRRHGTWIIISKDWMMT